MLVDKRTTFILLNLGGIAIFKNQKMLTREVLEKIPVLHQFIMWELICDLPVNKDYLQVFSMSEENGKQKLIHSQECPEYKKEYILPLSPIITGKVFVIDDGEYSTMLMNYEY